MSVEIREIVLTARITPPPPPPAPTNPQLQQRELIEACVSEVWRLLERRSQR